MSFIRNIQSVAKYESKILIRSWFFRVFTVLAVLFLGSFGAAFVMGNDTISWMGRAIPSNIPYVMLLLLNTGQAIIAIFLSSEFLKRDKKLDTSEVFYVHPLSNAEYVFGKIWGNLLVFLLLNFIIMGITLIYNAVASNTYIDWQSYILYFFIICLPTLIFIIGLSIFLMLVLKNQALTFIILLGYVGLTLMYIGDKFYYLFDYMAYSLPLLKSSIVGFTNYGVVINHRAIYLFAGLAFIFLTIALFNRLPNSRRSNYPWIALGCLTLLVSIGCGYNHVQLILNQGHDRSLYTSINNKYVDTPKMVIDEYNILLEQHSGHLLSEVEMKGVALASSDVYAFCLNPGLKVEEVISNGQSLPFTRDHQIVLVNFPQAVAQGDSLSLSIKYKGKVDDNFCYLDIPDKILQEQNNRLMMNVDKKYAFQTSRYLLVTPETYWYPRPGIAYSDENPDWQQTYFSNFRLRVKTLPGLIPISQGERTTGEDGSFSFTTDYPHQSISLIIGEYETQSVMADSVMFNLTLLKGHDVFTAPFDSIKDTIPHYLRSIKENFERTYKLGYPFKRFSVVEVPAQFYSYPRSWSQAQETVQPEMVLFPEKGWYFEHLDIEQRVKNHIRWSTYGQGEIDENEAKIRTLNDFLHQFLETEAGRRFSSVGRGRAEITSKPNPLFLFPQLYNFRYNIFSREWPVSNRVIELYLQNKGDNGSWERETNGLSNNEKANQLFAEYSFKDLQGSAKARNILDNAISLKAGELFAHAEINIGVKSFRDTVYSLLARNTFRNIQFEDMLDTLERISHAEIRPWLKTWYHPTPLPYYTIGRPEVIQITNRGKESFVSKLLITNDSDYDGVVHVVVAVGSYWDNQNDPRANRKLTLAPHQSKLLVYVWDEAPREFKVHTQISDNLPYSLTLPVGNIIKETGTPLPQEGDFVVEASAFIPPNEIIVDNEDPLFSLSAPAVYGLLPKWLDRVEETPFKYSGIRWWGPPLQWTATTNAGYYGRYVRSAYIIRRGDGKQTATWKVPIAEPGQYEIYYWAYNDLVKHNRRRSEGEYHFRIEYNDESEDAYLNLQRAGEEWEQLGVYYLDTDTVRIVLSNDSKLRTIAADAVKLVKR